MQDILVHITDPTDPAHGARGAARLAAALGGSLTGLYVALPDIPVPVVYDPAALTAVWTSSAGLAVRDAGRFEAAFVEWAGRMDVQNAVWAPCAGHPPDLFAQASAWHDAAVFRRDPSGEDQWSSPSGIARCVLATELPCLVLPPDVELDLPFSTAVVAWNGSPEAIRALHSAMPLLLHAERVLVLRGEERRRPPFAPTFPLERWLQARLPRATCLALEEESQEGDGILQAARDHGANLLVMGAYGRSRASERLLGGVTRHVLQHADMPVLMRH